MSELTDRSLLQQVLADHVGEEVTLFLRDYTLVEGTHTRCVSRQGVVYKVSEDDVELITVSQFSKEAVVHVIKLLHVMEMQGRLRNKEALGWFAATEASRNMQWSGHTPWNR